MIDYDMSWLEQQNNSVITYNDTHYPAQLKEIADPPPVLFVRGNPDLLSLPQIAIVGSRNPSALGEETAFNFAKALSLYGFVITSGLALGIDGASHRGALNALVIPLQLQEQDWIAFIQPGIKNWPLKLLIPVS